MTTDRPPGKYGTKYMRPEIREAFEDGMRRYAKAMKLLAKH